MEKSMKKAFATVFALALAVGFFTPVSARESGAWFQKIIILCPNGAATGACMIGSSECNVLGVCPDVGDTDIEMFKEKCEVTLSRVSYFMMFQ